MTIRNYLNSPFVRRQHDCMVTSGRSTISFDFQIRMSVLKIEALILDIVVTLGQLEGVCYTHSNKYFQFLNNITHFFTHKYFHICFQTTKHIFLSVCTKQPLIYQVNNFMHHQLCPYSFTQAQWAFSISWTCNTCSLFTLWLMNPIVTRVPH